MSLPRLMIIGGGICGATVARLLSPHCATTVFEKSGRLSGRCASLLFRGTVIDQGAPYFALCPETRAFLDPVIGYDLLPVPGRIVDNSSGERYQSSDELVYIRDAANSLSKRLLTGLPNITVHTHTMVVSDEGSDALQTASGDPLPRTDFTVCTAPLPQAAGLFPTLLDGERVSRVYKPALMAAIAYPAGSVPHDGVYARTWTSGDGVLAFAARENLKLRDAKEDIFMIRATDAFSVARLEDDPSIWANELRAQFEMQWLGLTGVCSAVFPKRWRYAEITDYFNADERRSIVYSDVASRRRVYFAGDAFGMGSGIRAAVLAGAVVAKEIADEIGVAFPKSACSLLSAAGLTDSVTSMTNI